MTHVVREITPSSKGLADRIRNLAPASGTMLVIETAGAGDWTEAVEDGSRALLLALGDSLAEETATPLTVVIGLPGARPALTEAALAAAVRGTVGVAALEAAAAGRRVNTVTVAPATASADVAAVLAYLASEVDAGFTAGATIDLTRVGGSAPTAPGAGDRQASLPVLVTGAAGGLGGAVAEAFLASGRSVVLSDLPGAALDLQSTRLRAPAIGCDVTSEDDVAALAANPLLASGLSSLQVIHGVGGSGAIVGLAERPREMSLRINGTGAFNVVSALMPAVTRGQGSVVVLASQAGLVSETGNGAYCAAKFAAVSLVHSLAATAPAGVRVHALCPGPIDTPLMQSAFAGMAEAEGVTYEAYHASRQSLIPLGRFGAPEHMGSAAVLLDGLAATGVTLAPTGAFLLT
jgi:NAD(P)-dependent dehydrogenase (short-subunit alcohol dehydrogenase family)